MDLKFEAFKDDPDGIGDDCILFRRVAWDSIGGRDRCPPGEVAQISKNAFNDYPDARARALGYPGPCMSVAVESVLSSHGLGPEQLLVGHPGYGVVRVRAGDLRSLKRLSNEAACPQGVMAAPEEDEPWHAVVFEPNGGPRQKPVKAAIAAVASWVIPLRNDG